jgi:hypothetical protein
MCRLRPHLPALAFGIALAVSPAAVQAREDGKVPVRLVSPRAGAALTAGSTVELEWAPFAEIEHAEEWEAFLSLNDGKTYPIRITPHLDLDLHRVRWQVPDVPTSAARLLLRFGDEIHEEQVLKLPQRFAIVPSPIPPLAADFAFARVAPTRGEPALPGHRGVVSWVEGSRRGGSLRQVVADVQPEVRDRIALPEAHPEPVLLSSGQAPLPLPRPVRGSPSGPPPAYRTALAMPGEGPLVPADILILIQRQNE